MNYKTLALIIILITEYCMVFLAVIEFAVKKDRKDKEKDGLEEKTDK